MFTRKLTCHPSHSISKNGFRQGDAPCPDFFNVILKKSFQLLVYTDNVDIKGRPQGDVNGVFAILEKVQAKMSLAVIEGKARTDPEP